MRKTAERMGLPDSLRVIWIQVWGDGYMGDDWHKQQQAQIAKQQKDSLAAQERRQSQEAIGRMGGYGDPGNAGFITGSQARVNIQRNAATFDKGISPGDQPLGKCLPYSTQERCIPSRACSSCSQAHTGVHDLAAAVEAVSVTQNRITILGSAQSATCTERIWVVQSEPVGSLKYSTRR